MFRNELAISKTRRNLAWEQRNGRNDVGLKRIETRENKCRKRDERAAARQRVLDSGQGSGE